MLCLPASKRRLRSDYLSPRSLLYLCGWSTSRSLAFYGKYIAKFEVIPESLKDKRCMDVDRTPVENLAYFLYVLKEMKYI